MIRLRRSPAHAGLSAVLLAALFVPGAGAAAVWELAADVSERLEADTNIGLDSDSGDFGAGSTTSVGVLLGVQTETTRWRVRAGATVSGFVGSSDKAGLNSSDPDFRGTVRHKGKNFTARAVVSYKRRPVTFTQFGLDPLPDGSLFLPDGTILLPDGSVTDISDFETITRADATRSRINAQGSTTLFLDSVNSLSFSAFGEVIRFSGDTGELVPNTNIGVGVSWGHSFSPLTSANFNVGVSRFTTDETPKLESISYSATGGIVTELSPQLDFHASAGVTFSDSERPGFSDNTSVGFNGDALLQYTLSDTTFSLTAKQKVSPSSLGELQNVTTFGAGVGHQINSRSNVGLWVSYSRQKSTVEDGTENRQFFAVSPNYSMDLTEDWKATVGYVFRLSDIESDLETSNNFFVTISRSFDLLH